MAQILVLLGRSEGLHNCLLANAMIFYVEKSRVLCCIFDLCCQSFALDQAVVNAINVNDRYLVRTTTPRQGS